MGDIKFENNDVIAEGSAFLVTAPDIKLDNPSRRSGGGEHRRALVHDFNDGLTINWTEDYPGGVTIRGNVAFPHTVSVAQAEGTHLRLKHHDLHLNSDSRRGGHSGDRRALVHDFQDGLTVNWAEDYTGGVTIRGEVKIPQQLSVGAAVGTHLRLAHHDLHLDNAARRSAPEGSRRALVHDFSDGLTINWSEDYPGGVTIRGRVRCPQQLDVGGVDVASTIEALKQQIETLEARVAALEAGS